MFSTAHHGVQLKMAKCPHLARALSFVRPAEFREIAQMHIDSTAIGQHDATLKAPS